FADSHVEEMETAAFRQALQTGTTYFSNPYYDKADSTVVWIIAEPVFGTSEKPVGTLSAIISLEELLNQIGEQSSNNKLVYVVDNAGNLLLHPQKSMMEQQVGSDHQLHPKNLSSSAIVSDYMRTRGKFSTVRVFSENANGKSFEILGAYAPV